MDKLKLHSKDLTAENIEKLAALFPNCLTETTAPDGSVKHGIDFDLLRQELSDDLVEGPQERYRLDWPGKREALATANQPINLTLRPCPEESVDFDTTENLYIEGDNLDALKLLQETYLGQVKMIYIDPPYNTGNDFIYDDNYSMTRDDYRFAAGEVDEDGNQMFDEEKWQENSSARGRFHSEWLSMIYPRLRITKNLLAIDGVIFISIDDSEVYNLRKICNEVFGEHNFIAEIAWEGANKNTAQYIGVSHEYVLVYARSSSDLKTGWKLRKEDTESVLKEVSRLKKKHGENYSSASLDLAGWFRSMKGKPAFAHRRFRFIDKHGAYKEDDPTAPGGRKYALINPLTKKVIPLRKNRGWGFSQEDFNKMVEDGKISFVTDSSVMVRRYLHETDSVTPQSIFYQPVRSASERLANLIGSGIFPYPKDETIISQFVEMATSPNDIVLDFFSGSATTAHAVMKLNAEDGGNRRHIQVQLPEPCDEKSAAFKAGYPTIAEIGKERIRRAGAKIRAELEAQLEGELPGSDKHTELTKKLAQLDTGFRVLKVDSSNMTTDFYKRPDETTQDALALAVENIKPDRQPEDLLFQVMLDWGIPLSFKITTETIEGKTVFFVAPGHEANQDAALAACFETNLDDNFSQALAKKKPLRAVFRDASFANDAARINVEQYFKTLSPTTEVKAI